MSSTKSGSGEQGKNPSLAPDDRIPEILKRTDLVQLIGKSTELKPQGEGLFKGLCPFHQEKTPSFQVQTKKDKPTYHCFGCGAHGDALDYVQAQMGLQPHEAIDYLGELANLPKRLSDPAAEPQIAARQAAQAAQQWYCDQLAHPLAQVYLKRRKITQTRAKEFGLGFALPEAQGWDNLHRHLSKLGFSTQAQDDAGLIKQRPKEGSWYDRLRNRLVFPIHNHRGELCGFSGREVEDKNPKYINPSNSGLLYKKKQILFGWPQAKAHIRKKGWTILTEGYLDVIALHEVGRKEAIGSCGTALSVETVELMAELGIRKLFLAYDGDQAGKNAALSAAKKLIQSEIDGKILFLPNQMDPKELVDQAGKTAFDQLLKNAVADYRHVIDTGIFEIEGKGLSERETQLSKFLEFSSQIKNEAKRAFFIEELARSWGIDLEILNKRLIEIGKPQKAQKAAEKVEPQKPLLDNAETTALKRSTAQNLYNKILALAKSDPASLVEGEHPEWFYQLDKLNTLLFDDLIEALKKLGLRSGTIRKIIAAQKATQVAAQKKAEAEAKERKPQSREEHDSYFEEDNSFKYWGLRGPEKLSNFGARIVEELVVDDGAEQTRDFVLQGRLEDQSLLRRIQIPASKFGEMKWVAEEWGGRAVVYARKKEEVRTAIQLLSAKDGITISNFYGYTGWVQNQNGDWVYLTNSGGITANGLDPNYKVRLHELKDYNLPAPVGNPKEAANAALQLLIDLPLRLGVAVLSTAIRPLFSFLSPCDFSVFYYGESGSKKSCLTALSLGFYGSGFKYNHLPANWSSTANALGRMQFQSKDAPLVIDDFVPPGIGSKYAQEMHAKAEQVLRSQANGGGRQRLNPDSSSKRTWSPRGLTISSGEDIPKGKSLKGRMLTIEVKPKEVDNEKLTRLQDASERGDFARAASHFICWSAQNMDWVKEQLRVLEKGYLESVSITGHARAPKIAASLMAGVSLFFSWAESVGAFSGTVEDRQSYEGSCWDILAELAADQAAYQEDENEAATYLRLLQSAISSKAAHLERLEGSDLDFNQLGYHQDLEAKQGFGEEVRYRSGNPAIGFVDDLYAYITEETAFSVINELARRQGNQLPLTMGTYAKRLKEANLIIPEIENTGKKEARVRATKKKNIKGHGTHRYLWFPIEILFPDETTEEERKAHQTNRPLQDKDLPY